MTTYFGFAIADSMLPDNCSVSKRVLVREQDVKDAIAGSVPCINPSHEATIVAMKERFGIEVEIPENPPIVSLKVGDKLVVMSVRGLPRLTSDRHYTAEEIAKASFKFSEYIVGT